jgi:tetratricopeptide (TPR) repeat protein
MPRSRSGAGASHVYDEPVVRSGDSELAIREQVAKALTNKAFTLGQLNRAADALAVYDDVVARFGDAPEPAIREQVAKALANKAFALGQLDRAADALPAYDELVVRFGDAPEPVLREQVAKALVNKAITLGRLERPTEALATYDEVIARFGDTASRSRPRQNTEPPLDAASKPLQGGPDAAAAPHPPPRERP